MCTESLAVNRDLLDPNFDGYKLSLDPLPIYQINVGGVDCVKLRDDEYTLQHVKAFGITNHLILDHWNPDNVLYVDNTGSIMQMRVVLESELSLPKEVFRIPNFKSVRGGHRHNVTLHFPSKDLCVLSNGAGMLYVLKTGDRDRDSDDVWKVVFQQEVCNEGKPFTIQHSTVNTDDVARTVHCLVFHIEECEKKENQEEEEEDGEGTGTRKVKKPTDLYEVFLEWFSLTQESDSAEFKLTRSRQFKGKTAPTYAAIDETGQFVYIASPANFDLVHDSGKEVVMETDKKDDKKEDQPLYTWTQSEEDVTITFILPETVTRREIHFQVTMDRLELGVKEKAVLLEGALHRGIDPALCTWTFNKRKLEVMLAKQEEGPMWTDLVVGNNRGQYVVDADQARRIHEKLEHLTAAELNADPVSGTAGAGINAQDLEECDVCTEENMTLMRYDAENHVVTNQVNIGTNQCLFTSQLDPARPPCLCLRHDVDGLIWQPQQPTQDTPKPWRHTNTFNALGYVQASKRERKFSACSPSASYVVLCDCVRHLYIYRQPTPTENLLKNRKSGRIVGAIAKQQLISLDSTEDILGMQVTEERIFVLTASKLYIVKVSI